MKFLLPRLGEELSNFVVDRDLGFYGFGYWWLEFMVALLNSDSLHV